MAEGVQTSPPAPLRNREGRKFAFLSARQNSIRAAHVAQRSKRMKPRDAEPLTPLRCVRGSVSILGFLSGASFLKNLERIPKVVFTFAPLRAIFFVGSSAMLCERSGAWNKTEQIGTQEKNTILPALEIEVSRAS